MTQQTQIKEMLQNSDWVCGTQFLQNYLSEYRSLINKLRRAGYQITTRSCENPGHVHKSRRMQEWRLLSFISPIYSLPTDIYKVTRVLVNGKPIHPKAAEFLERWKPQEIKKETTQRLL